MLCYSHILWLENNIVGIAFLSTTMNHSSRVLDASISNRRKELAHFLWLTTHHHRKNRCIYIFERQIQFETSLLPRRYINTLLNQSITNSIYLFLTHRIFKVQIVAAIIIRYVHLIEISLILFNTDISRSKYEFCCIYFVLITTPYTTISTFKEVFKISVITFSQYAFSF